MRFSGDYKREEAWKDLYAQIGDSDVAAGEVSVESSEEVPSEAPPSFADLFKAVGMDNFDPMHKGFDENKKSQKKLEYPRLPQAKLDLHGEIRANAETLVRTFVYDSRTAGHLFVLISPGVGKHSPGGVPKLRPMVVELLEKMQNEGSIKKFRSAVPRHGGYGALYVYLK